MKVKVYAKSACCLHSKLGAYSYQFLAVDGGIYSGGRAFKNSIKTLAQADCMAFVNALYALSQMPVVETITHIEIVTDSGVVAELIDVYKFQKHCEGIAGQWRTAIKPAFTVLESLTITKVGKEIIAGDSNKFTLINMEHKAQNLLAAQKEIAA